MKARTETIFKPRQINKSILSDDDVKEVLIAAYPSLFSKDKFADGSACLLCCGVNDTYKISVDNNEYIYRIYTHQWKTKKAILAEIGLVNTLNTTHYPINTDKGEWITGIDMPEGIRFGVLLSYVKGNMAACSLETAYLIGEQLALLHTTLDGQANVRNIQIYDEYNLVSRSMAIVQNAMQNSRNGSIERLKKCKTAVSALPMPILSPESYGICHGDAHFNNTVIRNNTIEFIDFDLCGYGARTYDLATFMWKIELLSAPRAQKSRMQLALLRGYEQERELSDAEKISIPTLMAWRYTFWLGAQARLLPNLHGYLLFSNNYYNMHLSWLEHWVEQGHSNCTRLLLSGALQQQADPTESIVDIQIEWWQKQRKGLINQLNREEKLCREVLHFAHLHSQDNLLESLNPTDPSTVLANSI